MSSRYKSAYASELVYFMGNENDASVENIAKHFGVTPPTIYEWQRNFPEFGEAYNKGKILKKKNGNHPMNKYNKDTPDKIIKLFSQGMSQSAVCAELNVTTSAFCKWMKEYPEVLAAVELGRLKEQQHWEQLGYNAMLGHNKDFNDRIWALSVKNRFNYSEKQELSSNPDKPLTLTVNFVNKENKE